jgi:hypothetical protein
MAAFGAKAVGVLPIALNNFVPICSCKVHERLQPTLIPTDQPLAAETPAHPDPYEPDALKLLIAAQQLKALAEMQAALEALRAVRADAIRQRAQGKVVHADLPIARLTKAIRQIMVLQQEICGLRDTQKRVPRRLQGERKQSEAKRQVKAALEAAKRAMPKAKQPISRAGNPPYSPVFDDRPEEPHERKRRRLARTALSGLAGHGRHLAAMDPDRRQGAAGVDALAQPQLAGPALCHRARSRHVRDSRRR